MPLSSFSPKPNWQSKGGRGSSRSPEGDGCPPRKKFMTMTPLTLFPPIDLTLLALVLSGVTGGVLLLLLILGMKQPVLWRMGLRHVLRRSSQMLLLLFGLSLSAAVMTASFGLWESLPSVGVVSGKHLFGNAADQQFYWLLPLLSVLLVGAGLLL